MTAIKIKYYNYKQTFYPAKRFCIESNSKVARLFRTVQAAIDGDEAAEITLPWNKLTTEEQAIATINSECLANLSN